MIKNNHITSTQQQIAAAQFAKDWAGRGYEKGDTQRFWLELVQKVFGVEDPYKFIEFEDQVMVESTNFMDGYIPTTKVLIEQKSIEKELGKPVKQSDGSWLNPFQQAKKYVVGLPLSRHPRWIVTCNFAEFWVYDMEQPNGEPQKIALKNLEKEYYRLSFLVDSGNAHLKREMEVSVKAGELVGVIYDKLLELYIDKTDEETLRALNILCVRLVFCLYAEDALLFGSKTAFHDYLAQYPAKDIRRALIDLFEVLDTPIEQRDPYLDDTLKAFPYVNGGLYNKDEQLIIPQFSEELKQLLLAQASDDFDWSEISPTIFGAVFESTLNPETRRKGGMHYTSIENIHKVIDPLFMNELRLELKEIQEEKVEKQRQRRLYAFQNHLATLTFLDPACGSGNFLTETYLSLRRLENEVIRELYHGQTFISYEEVSPIKVSINQFYGIEINDFAVTVATTALWISEAQMLAETEQIIKRNIDFLPLKTYANIKEGNALRMDWSTFAKEDDTMYLYAEKLNVYKVDEAFKGCVARETPPAYKTHYKELNVITKDVEEKELPATQKYEPVTFDYIIGNPPFVGARMMAQGSWQKKDVEDLFGKIKDVQDLDYVCCWYKKAAQIIQNSHTQVCFVSTNSICQGSQVPILWDVLLNQYHIHINFAYQTFKWNSESSEKAAVHCVIIGFGSKESNDKQLFLSSGEAKIVRNISPYLLEGDNTFVISRKVPLCNVPTMNFGNQPRDGGHFILTDEAKIALLKKEPLLEKWIRPYVGAEEFINQKRRWCFWLREADPADIKRSKTLYDCVNAVRDFRLSSSAKTTNGYANVPNSFAQVTQPEGVDCLLVPRVSSERRKYAPIGFIKAGVVASDAVQIVPEATLYHFGILTSIVHMAWMRVVCGRLKSDYRYSKEQVYNTYPWPMPSDVQCTKIETTAQQILDTRTKYQHCSLAELYDVNTMPIDLRKAHDTNDKAVMAAYGFDSQMTENEIVAELFKLYQKQLS